MKQCVFFLLKILFLLSLTFCKEKDTANRFWVNKNIVWKSAKIDDPEIGSILEAATVNVVILHENGQFRLLSGNGRLESDSISLYVEIFKIYSGTWERKIMGVLN